MEASTVNRSLEANLADVEARIAAACARAGRKRSEVTLVAVTKTRTVYQVARAYACGLRDFGENRVEEAEPKVLALRERFEQPPRWHMIGHIQSRKARQAVALSWMIHSVDSLRLAERLDSQAHEHQSSLPILLEVNVSGEESKSGFPGVSQTDNENLAIYAERITKLEHLEIRGLMTMAPLSVTPEATRPVFRALYNLREFLRQRCPDIHWAELSMGMTNDYEVAIEEGATMVRIGRAIFGP